jgi:DNA polymerase/3'-5' exonuclease PolX
VFSKAAKAIREAELPLKTKKDAMTLKGVGKTIAENILELNEKGSIEKLEMLRAGLA